MSKKVLMACVMLMLVTVLCVFGFVKRMLR